ncbi:MAG: DUF4159 domain-containing protein [Hyphomicrobiaceae bacterium]|nr:DUF4159 domain-containing protein [Hyphomicrobiaceae bacterium]
MSLGALAFLNPLALTALLALPIIYWLLRTVPPRPRQLEFPPTRILLGLENREKTPAKTPWWLLLIRLLAAALVILALAEPILNPQRDAAIPGRGPVALVVDNGWTSAPRWAERAGLIERLITEAESQSRAVIVVATAASAKGQVARIQAPAEARNSARALSPQPFAPDRAAAAEVLAAGLAGSVDQAQGVGIVWLSDGIDHAKEAASFVESLAALSAGVPLVVVTEPQGSEPQGLIGRVGASGRLEAVVVRSGGPASIGSILATSAKGEILGTATYAFEAGATRTEARLELPLELRNQVARLALAGQTSTGAVSLLDQRSQWQRVGLISGESIEQAQPLLAPFYYIEKALAPTAEIVKPKTANLDAALEDALAAKISVLALADIGTLPPDLAETIAEWIGKGGVLVRFAGPRLEKGGDDLLPVPLRIGGRTLGGALSWSSPQRLATFEEASLFTGLAIPADVMIRRQVLADPGRLGPDVQVWARLTDGTPLVTAARRGEGLVVLFHVTGNSDWSNLPLSGLFVDMLKRIVLQGRLGGGPAGEASALANGTEQAAGEATLAPISTLDGFGVLSSPPPAAKALLASAFDQTIASLDHPPGYYGSKGAPRALNVLTADATLPALPALPIGSIVRGFEGGAEALLKPSLLALALGLVLVDILAVLLLQAGGLAGLIGRRGSGGVTATSAARTVAGPLIGAGLLLGVLAAAGEVSAQPVRTPVTAVDAKAALATAKVTLGYVLTGDVQADETSRQGLSGLAKVLQLRSAVTPGEPIAVDILRDEIAFYPVLYWPVPERPDELPREILAKIDAYMKQGGMIIFDTRDQGKGLPSGVAFGGDGRSGLQRILGQLDLPRLEPVPDGHVLGKSFYLLRSFPGRWDGGQMWVEAGGVAGEDGGAREARRADGVTSIIVTSNDLAAAWALDERGRPLYPVVPGGEVQREMAFRTGINIVMHALTGNYKADQVHVPALLERLGQ